ncbi:hypothetical protein FLX56_20300 [Synechococcus moorigangaii CMS01]|nr:hypothetical protein [Synechococcus moorigangaii CMS01]
MGNLWKPWTQLCQVMGLGGIMAIASGTPGVAQRGLSLCQPPQNSEFLVLVFTPSQPLQTEVRRQVTQTLPANQQPLVCEYNGNVLSRVGGFTSLETATQWAENFGEAVGLPLMVITPTDADVSPDALAIAPDAVVETGGLATNPPPIQPVAPSEPGPQATANSGRFQPQALQEGFGVIIDYGGDLAIATRLQSLLDQNIGLVVYGGRGYLLADQTEDATRVTELLARLNQNGLGAIAVPANQLILLKANINP